MFKKLILLTILFTFITPLCASATYVCAASNISV